MASQRMDRVNELLRREIAASLFRILDSDRTDLASITVTHVLTSPDLRRARVLVSVLGDEEKGRRTINDLVSHRKQIQSEMSSNVVLKYTPHLVFELDQSLEAGDRVLSLLDRLEPVEPEPEPDPESEKEHDEPPAEG